MQFLEEENLLLKGHQVDMENRDKRSNLVIQGISESVPDAQFEREFHRICRDHLKFSTELSVERIHWVGVKTNSRPRNVVLKFLSYKDREAVWERQRELKGTRLFLEEHYALEIQQARQQLVPYLQAARKRGERAALQVDKLMINGQKFSLEPSDLRSLQLRYREATKNRSEIELETDQEGAAVCFYGKHSVFSNFFLNPIVIYIYHDHPLSTATATA